MTRSEFASALAEYEDLLSGIRLRAHALHDAVGQTYGKNLPYGFHLDMVADFIKKHGAEACRSEKDAPVMIFGAYFHDSIEDARLTYNNLLQIANSFFNAEDAITATEIAYALTNEKGRTRAERANEKYYRGIRLTPYAPVVKLADRLANTYFSNLKNDEVNIRMRDVYRSELPHFLESVTNNETSDIRLKLPNSMLEELKNL